MANDSPSAPSGSGVSDSSSSRSSDPTTPDSTTDGLSALLTDEDDPLLPRPADVYRTFYDGKATWEAFLNRANGIPTGLWPENALNPYLTLVDVPSLPDVLPRSDWLDGRPCWELPFEVGATACEDHRPDSNTALTYGRRVSFQLQVQDPIRCEISQDAASHALGVGPETTSSLAVLVMCWSYILSVRLLELQRRDIQYTMDRLWPDTPQRQGGNAVDIDLESASPKLIRWLCAILSPKMGWRTRDQRGLPLWATSFTPDVKLGIKASVTGEDICSPPTSSEATELLIELCRLFKLGANPAGGSRLTPMPPYKASFLAAIALPFYEFMSLQPRLPHPRLTRPHKKGAFSSSHEQNIRGYLSDMRYFMTLSIHPPSIGSIIWSIFWQPDVDCNLVGPWLASFLDTLEPTIMQNRIEVLVKAFLSRRPRVAIWWLALFLLGNRAILDWIRRYAVKMEEKYGYGSLSPPDPMVSAWTGSKQSFLDLGKDSLYMEPSDSVSRADLLRCRFDLKLQDSANVTIAWRPFGHIQKERVEPEVWPQLETNYTRKYHSFIWYFRKLPISDKGFRKCTGRSVRNVPDNATTRITAKDPEENPQAVNVRPSKKCTRRMMSYLVEDAAGGRAWEYADMPRKCEQIRWLREWEGLYTADGPVGPDEQSAKPPSWFLEEWIKGKYDRQEDVVEAPNLVEESGPQLMASGGGPENPG